MQPDDSTAGRMPMALVGWLLLAAVWMTWAPFEYRRVWPELQLIPQLEYETVGHFFLLMPFGMLGVAWMRREPGRWNWRPMALVVVIGLALEVGQGWVETRSLSPHDVLVGYLGAVLATGATERFLRGGGTAAAVSRGVIAASLVVVWGLMVYGAVAQHRGLRLAGWTAGFPVLAGEEAGGLRAYEGSVDDARICAGDAYEVCAGPGADAGTRAKLARAALDSQRVRLTATVVSASDEQDGPTRIVTFSDGAYLRDVTLGQRRHNLILRLRTVRGGPNGTSMEFVLDGAVRRGEPTRVTATYARGVVTMEAELDGRTTRGVYRPPFRNSLRTQGLARPRLPEPLTGRAPLVGAIVQFLGLGLGLGYVVRSRAARMLAAPALALVFVWALDAALGHTLSPTRGDLVLVAAAAALGAVTRYGRLSGP